MRLKFIGEHKSLKAFESDELTDFTVITGTNGSGKSQLMELFHSIVIRKTPVHFSIHPPVNNIRIEGIENQNLNEVNNNSLKPILDNYIRSFSNLGTFSKQLCKVLIDNKTWLDELKGKSICDSIITNSREDTELLIRNCYFEMHPHHPRGNQTIEHFENSIIGHNIFLADTKHAAHLAYHVAKSRKKNILDVKDVDYYNTQIPEHFIDKAELFDSRLEYVFYNYAKRRHINRADFVHKTLNSEENESMSDAEFEALNVSPWDMINSILTRHNIQFQFKEIDKKDFSPDASIFIRLIKTTNDADVIMESLSSGEKVIMGLIIKLFTSSYYNEKLKFPELIFLDEPDAYLHPEMSKLLVDVLSETFVKKFGIKVIMTTHSPSTIALCPEDSIYKLSNHPITSLTKIEKEDALKLLTSFIPTLSIDYKNHRQVFVEGPTDVYYYQTIFNKVSGDKKYPFNLYFIANGYGDGDCNQVMKIVEDIRKSNIKTSFGVIDRDKSNKSNESIKVHGSRYSIEQYLLDPIYLCIILMAENSNGILNDLGLDKTFNQLTIGQQEDVFLQKVVDWFFGKFYLKYTKLRNLHSDNSKVEYLNGKKVDLPNWFLNNNGHNFRKQINEVFQIFGNRYGSSQHLEKEIIAIIGKCYPFISKDSSDLIESLMV